MSRVISGLIGVSTILIFTGCNSDLTSLNPFKDKALEKIKQDATLAKETLEMSKQCLKLSKSVKEANECNQKAKEHYPKLELDNFKRWNGRVKKRVLKTIDTKISEAECILKAESIDGAKSCLSGDSNTTKDSSKK